MRFIPTFLTYDSGRLHFSAIVFLLVFVALSLTPTWVDAGELQQQRANYQRAEKLLREGKIKQFQKRAKSLKQYPLYPYLQLQELSRRLRTAKTKEVKKFLEQYKQFSIARRLHSRWLYNLANRKQWQTFLQFYDDTHAGTELRCYYLRALLSTGKANDAFAGVPSIWLAGKSQPKSCDPLFERWIDAGKLTEELTWRRLHLALEKNQISLARYLSRLLKQAKYKSSAATFMAVHKDPKRLKKLAANKQQTALSADIFLHGIRRWARTDVEAAAKLFDKSAARFQFDSTDLTEAKNSLAYRFLITPSKYGLKWLSKQIETNADPDLIEYTARLTLLYQNWPQLLAAIERMPVSLRQQMRWRYWSARAQQEINGANDSATAEAIFVELADKRDYYGFLAAIELGQTFDFNDHALRPDAAVIAEVAELPGIKMALELYAVGQLSHARREWLHAIRGAPPLKMVAAAALAHQWGWDNQAITTTIKAETWNELTLRFPISFLDYMKKGARIADIDLAWMYAIARQESAMKPDAMSPVGARGLMQLMPATARETVNRSQLPLSKPQLLEEKHNSLIGSAHLSELMDYYANSRILASGAYNAGRRNVDGWLKRSKQTLPFDVWIETIPFRETRGYVQNVLMFASIYDYRMGDTIRFVHADERVIKP
ncbi:MAG: transglycosylase SLT domain-containing protein [Pseudomonadales bacterium]